MLLLRRDDLAHVGDGAARVVDAAKVEPVAAAGRAVVLAGDGVEGADALGGEALELAGLVARQVVGVDEAQGAEFPRVPLRGVWGG